MAWCPGGRITQKAFCAPPEKTWSTAKQAAPLPRNAGGVRRRLGAEAAASLDADTIVNVQGDEPEVLKKMRFNQLQGGAFTGYGIGRMYSPARVMELPFLFRNTDEIDYVRGEFMPQFRTGFEKNGYELLGWMEGGVVGFFCNNPL